MNRADRAFVKDRNEAFLSLDPERVRAFCRKHGIAIPADEEVFWALIHKARLQITSFGPEVREESRQWLREHGFTSSLGPVEPLP